MLRPLKISLYWLVTLLLLAALTVAVLMDMGKLPYKTYLVHTGSMGHTIRSGSVVLVQEHKYHVGQVITFEVNGNIVTHRLIAINHHNGTITTKGDANQTVDPWHPPVSNIVGGVIRTFPFIGRVQYYFFDNWFGGGSLVFLILIMLILWVPPVDRKEERQNAPNLSSAT